MSAMSVEEFEYAAHGGESLVGDFYRAESVRAAPVVIAVHGGGWKIGSRSQYQHWGRWLANHGFAVFAISYRLSQRNLNRHPAALEDLRAAIGFVAENAEMLAIDPGRIGLMGASAGAHLAALAALQGETAVKAVIGVYGIYDLLAQWQHDLVERPRDQITEILMGTSPLESRLAFVEASPITYVTVKAKSPSFLVCWGTADDVVEWETQSRPFVTALKQAGYFVRTVPIPGAPHFWMSGPLDEPNGYPAFLAPKLLDFLGERL